MRDHPPRRAGGGAAVDSASRVCTSRANVTGTLNLLEAACQYGVRRFVFASSSSVYGLCKNPPFREDDAALPGTISPYAATKLAGGAALLQLRAPLRPANGVSAVFHCVRTRVSGPDLAIHQFTRRIHRGETIDQFGDGGTRARLYLRIDDIIQGVLAALDYQGARISISSTSAKARRLP